MQHNPRFLKLVNESKGRIKECTPQELNLLIEQKKVWLIDVREESEWSTGHIPTACYLGKGIIERDIETVIADTQAEIIVYCRGGFRSILVADTLQNMGYSNVYSLQEGLQGWINSGYKLAYTENE